MGLVWFVGGLLTYFLAQWFYKWQKPYGLPWYTWLLAALSYLGACFTIATIITLSQQASRWGSKPVMIMGGLFLVITVILATVTRTLAVSKIKKTGKAAAAA